MTRLRAAWRWLIARPWLVAFAAAALAAWQWSLSRRARATADAVIRDGERSARTYSTLDRLARQKQDRDDEVRRIRAVDRAHTDAEAARIAAAAANGTLADEVNATFGDHR